MRQAGKEEPKRLPQWLATYRKTGNSVSPKDNHQENKTSIYPESCKGVPEMKVRSPALFPRKTPTTQIGYYLQFLAIGITESDAGKSTRLWNCYL